MAGARGSLVAFRAQCSRDIQRGVATTSAQELIAREHWRVRELVGAFAGVVVATVGDTPRGLRKPHA